MMESYGKIITLEETEGINMIPNRGMDTQNTSHIPLIWRYIRIIAYMNESSEIAINNKKR